MEADQAGRNVWLPAALLWLGGSGLRITILAVPPVIASIRDEFGLNATQVGLLSSIPPALFALASLAGSLLVARLGVKGALVGGLLLVAVGSALRGFSASYAALFVMTIIMSAGVAIMQPIMPAAVRQWLPARVGLGTAIYTNGLLVGELLPVWLTIPFLLPHLGGQWRMALFAWSVPIAFIAVAVFFLAPRQSAARDLSSVRARWRPDWHQGLVWRLGILFCCVNAIYFSTNAFIPIYLKSAGRPDLISGALTALNFGQVPASLLLLLAADKLERRVWPYIASGVVSLFSVAALVLMIGPLTPLWAGLLGFADASALIVGLTLPALLCPPQDVARIAAGTFTISYGGAVLIAVVSGAAWDVSGEPALAFVPVALCAAALACTAGVMRAKSDLR